jgi:hypothetical protein
MKPVTATEQRRCRRWLRTFPTLATLPFLLCSITAIAAPSQQAYLKASNTEQFDRFGNAVAVSGDTVIVGAYHESSDATGVNGSQVNNNAPQSGAAYAFVRNGTNWSQQAYLKASHSWNFDLFGQSVGISGDTIVVGAIGDPSDATGVNGDEDRTNALNSGAAYVFVRTGTNWAQQAYLKASNTDRIDSFGYSVAISGDSIVIGAANEDSATTGVNGNQTNKNAPGAGAAYVFVRDGTKWTQQAYLKASNTESNDQFGWSVAISGDTVVVGARSESSSATGVNGDQSDNSAVRSGAAYVFVRNGTNWSQQAYLKASNTGAGDVFYTVAISGDMAVVGAQGESSSASGVNGDQSDNSYSGSGAAYVFVRNGTNWSQQAYLKASNTRPIQDFGWSVAASGDLILVGANQESSNATGLNGNQNNTSAGTSGAAYLFVRNGTNWSQLAYIKASNTKTMNQFGYSVGLSGDTAVIGSLNEPSNATGVNGNQTDITAFGSGAAYVFAASTLLTLQPETGGFVARGEGWPGLNYRLQRAPAITGPWSDLATNTASASGLLEFHDTLPPPGQAFYRTAQP